jgi:putative membrane protein insertion efficiency factor
MINESIKVIKKIILLLIKAYQMTRPTRLSCCRFYPSCSDYCQHAIEKHGVLKGLTCAFIRLAKCNPWHQGGVDLVEF